MEVYEHKGYTFHWIGCHECKKGGNGSGECNSGGNITDDYLHRGCWSGTRISKQKNDCEAER